MVAVDMADSFGDEVAAVDMVAVDMRDSFGDEVAAVMHPSDGPGVRVRRRRPAAGPGRRRADRVTAPGEPPRWVGVEQVLDGGGVGGRPGVPPLMLRAVLRAVPTGGAGDLQHRDPCGGSDRHRPGAQVGAGG